MSVHSRNLAKFVCGSVWADIAPAVRHEALRSLINYFAAALAAANDPTVDKAIRVMLPFAGDNKASLIGRRERFDLLHAAAINAMAANVYDFDDTHIPTIVHPTAPVAAALFALAQTRVISGDDFLLAFVLGVEIECRIANAISPGHYARGWHITSTCGVFGAAAATAKILGLNEQQMGWALGNAAAQSAGLVETLGSSAKSISVGNAARNGLMSALLAQQGFEGPVAPLDGNFGWLKVVSDTVDWTQLDGEFDSEFDSERPRWQLQRNTYKPYPCGVVLNPVIDACLELAAMPEFAQRDIATITRITLTGHPLLRQRTDRPGVSNGRQSQVSAQHTVSVVLIRRRAGLPEFSDAAVADARVRALGAKVCFTDAAGMHVDTAKVTLTYSDGHTLSTHIAAARGSLQKPLTDIELEAKLLALCQYGQSGVNANALAASVWSLAQSRNVADTLLLASPETS